MDITRLEAISAIESLRSGVPNGHAVRILGCAQSHVESQVLHKLRTLVADGEPSGTLVSGGFGSGKSHLLTHLQEIALRENFVVSRVSISKETPLFDMGKLFRSVIENALVPGVTGRALQELALTVNVHGDGFGALQRWASGASDFLAATLGVFEHGGTSPETRERIVDFWAGDKLPIAELRADLRAAGLQAAYPGLRNPKQAELPPLRFAFASRLFRAAGLSGWVLLLDEVELIGRYSQMQRAKSYAELARWFGMADRDSVHWVTTVAAMTDEFDYAVLDGKQDWTQIPSSLRAKGQLELAARAERGMRTIRSDVLPLTRPSEDDVRSLYERLRTIYEDAYGWSAPDVFRRLGATSTPMRTYVRLWITAWDLVRLDPTFTPELESEVLVPDLAEDLDLEVNGDDHGST